jgi:hypothetical protein
MSEWKIRLPICGRDDVLIDVAAQTRHIEDPDEARVMRTIVHDATWGDGLWTAGELFDRLAAMSQPERRALLDGARLKNGLDTCADTEGHRVFVAANEELARRPAPPPPTCPACGRHPTDSAGMPDLNIPPVRQWWCEEHRGRAPVEDLGLPPSGIGLDMRYIDPDEVARERRADELREEANRQRREELEAEREERAAAREAQGANWQIAGPGWTPNE